MIIFHDISYKNFLSTGNTFTKIQLDENKYSVIVGKNGEGKSVILDAITFSLFGKPYRNVTKPLLVNTINGKELETIINFSIGSTKYKIIRGIKPNLFEIHENGIMIDQSANNRDYQAYLERVILQLNYKSFTQIVILGSATFKPFMQLSLQDRRSIIEELLDIKVFTNMNIVLKQKFLQNKGELSNALSHITQIKNHRIVQQQYIDKLEDNLSHDIKELHNECNKYKTLNLKLKEQKKEITLDINKLSTKILDNTAVLKKKSTFNDLQLKLGGGIKRHEKELKFYQDNVICGHCKQDIDEHFKQVKMDELSNIINEKNTALTQVFSEIMIVEKTLESYSEITYCINTNIKKLGNIDVTIDLNETHISNLMDKIEKSLSKTSIDQEEYVKLQRLDDDIISNEREYTKLIQQRHIYDYAGELLRDNGIKSHVVQQYIPTINKYINMYLNELDFFINFNLDETFKESIQSRHRDTFSYFSFSEGEKMKIDLAILLTWRMIAKLKNSVNCNLLIMDEITDSSLDQDSVDNLVKIINVFSDNINIFVISHNDKMIDKFENVIEVKKVNNFTKTQLL